VREALRSFRETARWAAVAPWLKRVFQNRATASYLEIRAVDVNDPIRGKECHSFGGLEGLSIATDEQSNKVIVKVPQIGGLEP